MKQIIFTLLFFALSSCYQNKKQDTYESYGSSNSNDYIQSDNNYHTDPNFEYEYRTGNSGNYEYNYDISGWDENGNSVYGNIDIQGKYGSGYILDEDGNEKYIDVEWVDYGVLEGTDEDGNSYEFEVDE
ncbi:MAG: hypothetical protein J5I52_01120 [Saprospiraceae bacterium]|nr:hypothetical protein [Saprospiraceae bacterium]MCZ2340148.1 hypothetical protein [Chitinophagales bacterium]